MHPDNTIGNTHYGVHDMNVVEFRRNGGPKNDGKLQYRCECYQKVWREWGAHLDPHEQIVALQLIDRTIGWGRSEAYFSARALLRGDGIYSGMRMGKTKLYNALRSLEERGIVRRRKDKHVPDRVHFSVNMSWAPAGANGQKQSEKASDRVRQTDNLVRDADNPVRQPDTIASNHKLISQASSLAGAAAPDVLP